MDSEYIDADLAYVLGLLVARGELTSSENVYRLVIHFPKGALQARGTVTEFESDREIRLGLEQIRERLAELLGGDVRTVDSGDHWDLVVRLFRQTLVWRYLSFVLRNEIHYSRFQIPHVIKAETTPGDYKREFIRGYADVAGNVRPANRDQAGRHRVRLDTLNSPTNWTIPVQLCVLIQEGLGVSVPNIAWGHPNLNREWREHQLNIYAEDFEPLGFSFDFKQRALEELAAHNRRTFAVPVRGCPGAKRQGPRKLAVPEENDSARLDDELVGKHFDAYWQICRALGCPRRPQPGEQLELTIDEF